MGDSGDAQPGPSTTASKPNAAALRSSVPTLPGSCTPSSARMRRAVFKMSAGGMGVSNNANTPWLDLVPLSFSATWGAISAGSNWASSGVFASAAAVAYIARGVQLLASSRQSFGPSAKKSPSAARCFSESRTAQAYLILAFSRLVIVSIVAPLLDKIN